VKEKSNLDPALIEEIVLGNVLCPGAPYVIRSAALAAGFPATTAASLVSRWCSSGLLAVQSVANQILSGSIDIGLAIGAESMSSNPDNGGPEISPELLENQGVRDADMPMGWTSENVASEFNISREAQDEFAARSFQRAERSQKAGWPVDEIVPLTVQWTNPKTGTSETVVVDRDDGIRYGTTAETLAKIKPAFPKWKPSTTTGGNASQITDGAAAILLMRRSTAEELGQPILAKFAASTVIAIEPRIMGIGPTIAIPKLFRQTGLTKEDVDIFEINEAFASMVSFASKACFNTNSRHS
jgi:acetyl-CoA acetyltransferase family protein